MTDEELQQQEQRCQKASELRAKIQSLSDLYRRIGQANYFLVNRFKNGVDTHCQYDDSMLPKGGMHLPMEFDVQEPMEALRKSILDQIGQRMTVLKREFDAL